MVCEQFHLSRNDFHVSAAGTFKTLIEDKSFVDVTLVCEDDKQLAAHKVILSANSIFFKNVLTNNHHQHPLIYLSGIKFCDLQSLVKFMYLGEVSIQEKNLQSFLLASETLKIEGLSSYYKMFTSVTKANPVKKGENSVEENFIEQQLTFRENEDPIDDTVVDKSFISEEYLRKENNSESAEFNHSNKQEFRLIDLSNATIEQVKGIHAEDDIVLMVSGEGVESMRRGHFDCFSWKQSSKAAGKKRNILSCNCIDYNSKGCPATKRKWICVGKCEFEKKFCCEHFKGDEILFCLYAFKHSHQPPQREKSFGVNWGGREVDYGQVQLVSKQFVVVDS